MLTTMDQNPRARRAKNVHIGTRVSTIAALAVTSLVFAFWALPTELRQTGEQGLDQLKFVPERLAFGGRVWIDTDAACGHGERVDPDDCLAITLLASHIGDQIAGISTVAGNAKQEVVNRTTHELVARLSNSTDIKPWLVERLVSNWKRS